MWYLASVSCLLLILAALTTAGAAFIDVCLPWRLRPAAREFLAPTLGLALLLVPTTLVGWLGHGFHAWFCLPLTVLIAAIGGWRESRRGRYQPRVIGRLLRWVGFVMLVSFPMLGQLLWFNAFSPFNDAWTYLYQAQWLQHHGFQEPALTSGHHPAAAAVLGFQRSGLRITPSFLLGWLQATFGVEWSYEIYPMTVSLALTCGALAVGGIVRAAFPERRREAWWAALAAGVTVNGFAFGAVSGFFPQTVGLAFSTAALALRGLEMKAHLHAEAGDHKLQLGWFAQHLRVALPLSTCLAAVVYCYPELLPFLIPALAISYVLPLPSSGTKTRARWTAIGSIALITSLVACFEVGRAVPALRMQTKVIAGNPVAWSPGGFLAQALGLRSGIYEGGVWFFENGWGILTAGALPAAGFGLLLLWAERSRGRLLTESPRRPRQQRWWIALAPTVLMTGTCAAAFFYFRFFVPNPWPNGVGPWAPGVGQTWSQLKLSLWASPALLAVASAMLIQLLGSWRWQVTKLFTQSLLAVWCAVGIGWNKQLLLPRANPIRLVSGEEKDPFGSYRAFCRSLDNLPQSDTFFLDVTPGDYASIKQRELLAYFLGDRELMGDWTVDDNIPVEVLPPAERKSPVQTADWIIRYHSPDSAKTVEAPLRLCRLTVSRVNQSGWALDSVSGGYDKEREPDGSRFYWTKHDLRMSWRRASGETDTASAATPLKRRMKVSFRQRSFASVQTITVRITGTAAGEQVFTVPATTENRRCESEPFVIAGDVLQASFSGTGEPRRASAADARELSFLVAAAMLEPVED